MQMCDTVQLMQVPSNAEESWKNVGRSLEGQSWKEQSGPGVKKAAAEGNDLTEKNTISSVFDGNYASRISHLSKNMWMHQVLYGHRIMYFIYNI